MAPPNPRVQRPRSSPSARHSPLTRNPLGRLKPQFRSVALSAGVLSFCAAAAASADQRHSCPPNDCYFPDTAGALVFAVGSPDQLSGALTYSLVVRDGEGECRKIEALLLKALSKRFPAWRYVAEAPADLEIVYQSGFSICLDECEDRPLPQGAQVQLFLGRGEVQANWSDDSHWRARGRLVSLFTAALGRAIRG